LIYSKNDFTSGATAGNRGERCPVIVQRAGFGDARTDAACRGSADIGFRRYITSAGERSDEMLDSTGSTARNSRLFPARHHSIRGDGI
jgi:hypothetical protein